MATADLYDARLGGGFPGAGVGTAVCGRSVPGAVDESGAAARAGQRLAGARRQFCRPVPKSGGEAEGKAAAKCKKG